MLLRHFQRSSQPLIHRCLFAVIALSVVTSAAVFAAPVNVQVETTRIKPLHETLTLHGTIKAKLTSDLSLSTDGLVNQLAVDVGSEVTQGELLLNLDDKTTRQQLAQTKARRQSSETQFKEASRKAKEAQVLHKKKHLAQTDLISLQVARDVALLDLEAIKAEEARIQHQLSLHTLYAPFSGIITAKNTERGEWLTKGQNAFTLVSLNEVLFDVQVPQEYYPKRQSIAQVTLYPDTAPNTEIAAELSTVVPVGQALSRTLLFRFAPLNSNPLLLPGTSAKAHIQFAASEKMVLISRDALIHHADEGQSVFVIQDGKAKRRSITVGKIINNDVQVLSGLSADELVVVRGNERLREGAEVTLLSAESTSSSTSTVSTTAARQP